MRIELDYNIVTAEDRCTAVWELYNNGTHKDKEDA